MVIHSVADIIRLNDLLFPRLIYMPETPIWRPHFNSPISFQLPPRFAQENCIPLASFDFFEKLTEYAKKDLTVIFFRFHFRCSGSVLSQLSRVVCPVLRVRRVSLRDMLIVASQCVREDIVFPGFFQLALLAAAQNLS